MNVGGMQTIHQTFKPTRSRSSNDFTSSATASQLTQTYTSEEGEASQEGQARGDMDVIDTRSSQENEAEGEDEEEEEEYNRSIKRSLQSHLQRWRFPPSHSVRKDRERGAVRQHCLTVVSAAAGQESVEGDGGDTRLDSAIKTSRQNNAASESNRTPGYKVFVSIALLVNTGGDKESDGSYGDMDESSSENRLCRDTDKLKTSMVDNLRADSCSKKPFLMGKNQGTKRNHAGDDSAENSSGGSRGGQRCASITKVDIAVDRPSEGSEYPLELWRCALSSQFPTAFHIQCTTMVLLSLFPIADTPTTCHYLIWIMMRWLAHVSVRCKP